MKWVQQQTGMTLLSHPPSSVLDDTKTRPLIIMQRLLEESGFFWQNEDCERRCLRGWSDFIIQTN